MSQSYPGNMSSPLSGESLVNDKLEPFFAAELSNHSGNSRPSYAVAQMIWVDTTTTPWVINMFDGSDDISLGTVNASTNTFTPSVVTMTAAGTTFNPSGLEFTATNVQAAIEEGLALARRIVQNSKSAAYTLALSDAGKHIYHPSADTTARIWTIPANSAVAFPIGTAITMVNDSSAGAITIQINTDTLVQAGSGATGPRTLAANGQATILKVTSTRWQITGVGLS